MYIDCNDIMEGNKKMIETLIALISAATGFMLKSLWQANIDRQKDIEKTNRNKRIANIEAQLADFYWPVYLRLQKDNVIWEKILDRDSEDEDKKKTGYEIEKSIILPNHEEIVRIIENNIHRARPDKEMEDQLLQYLRHISVYQSIRNAGIIDKDPLDFNEPWPENLFRSIEEKTHSLQEQYDRLISDE